MRTILVSVAGFASPWTVHLYDDGTVLVWRGDAALMGRGRWLGGRLVLDTEAFDDGNAHVGPEFARLCMLVAAAREIEMAIAKALANDVGGHR